MTKEEVLRIASSHYNEQINSRQVTERHVTSYEVASDKYSRSLFDVEKRLEIKLKRNGAYSKFLHHQLARHLSMLGEKFSVKEEGGISNIIEYYNALEILDIIENIETNKLSGTPYNDMPLRGLHKIHHGAYSGTGRSLLFNIRNYWFNSQNQLHKKREAEFNAIIDELGLNSLSAILFRMHDKVYSKKLTGEWLIYTESNEKKYFLCLAVHHEGDQQIFENKIKPALQQFPELKNNNLHESFFI